MPIVGGNEQASGYFMLPVGSGGATPGIGLAGLCGQNWTFRYLPPAQYVLDRACDDLRAYVSANNGYWKVREVPPGFRFQGWLDPEGRKGWDPETK